jgi:hypothetical protein
MSSGAIRLTRAELKSQMYASTLEKLSLTTPEYTPQRKSEMLSRLLDALLDGGDSDEDHRKCVGYFLNNFEKRMQDIETHEDPTALAKKFMAYIFKHGKKTLLAMLSTDPASASATTLPCGGNRDRLIKLLPVLIDHLELPTIEEKDRQQFRILFAENFKAYIELIIGNSPEVPSEASEQLASRFMAFIAKPGRQSLLGYYQVEYSDIVATMNGAPPYKKLGEYKKDAATVALSIQKEYVDFEKDLSMLEDKSADTEDKLNALLRSIDRLKALDDKPFHYVKGGFIASITGRLSELPEVCADLLKNDANHWRELCKYLRTAISVGEINERWGRGIHAVAAQRVGPVSDTVAISAASLPELGSQTTVDEPSPESGGSSGSESSGRDSPLSAAEQADDSSSSASRFCPVVLSAAVEVPQLVQDTVALGASSNVIPPPELYELIKDSAPEGQSLDQYRFKQLEAIINQASEKLDRFVKLIFDLHRIEYARLIVNNGANSGKALESKLEKLITDPNERIKWDMAFELARSGGPAPWQADGSSLSALPLRPVVRSAAVEVPHLVGDAFALGASSNVLSQGFDSVLRGGESSKVSANSLPSARTVSSPQRSTDARSMGKAPSQEAAPKSKLANSISTAFGWTGGISAGLGLAGCIAIAAIGTVAWPVSVGVLGLLAIGAGCLCAATAISNWSATRGRVSTTPVLTTQLSSASSPRGHALVEAHS